MILLILLVLAALPGAATAQQCLAVDGEWVTAGDVAGRVPWLAGSDPALRLVRTPFPGARRVVGPGSLPGVEDPAATPFCVERRMHTLAREIYAEAVKQTLTLKGGAEIRFELVDYDRAMVPSGRLEFMTQTLPPVVSGRTEDAVLWRGKLFYADARSLPVWVRLRLWVEAEVCVLSRDLARSEDLKLEDCRLSKVRYPPFTPPPLRDGTLLEKMIAARRLKAGEPIYQAGLAHKPEVEAGKPVELRVVNGGAVVRFQAKAVSSGRRGDSVAVTVPVNGKRLEGQVVGKGSVEVRLK